MRIFNLMFGWIIRWLSRPATPEEIFIAKVAAARGAVAKRTGKTHPHRLDQAQHRAERSVHAGLDPVEAADRACKWARCATEPYQQSASAVVQRAPPRSQQ
jgi:hypothetical protein